MSSRTFKNVDFNACQSRNIDEGFDRAKMIMERLPYNVKHFLSLGFIRWFLFHLFCHTYTVWLASQKYFCSLWEFQKLFRLLCILDSSWVLLKLLCDTKMCCMLILVSKLYTVMQTELLHLFSSVSLIASHAFHLWINTMYHLLQIYLFLHRNPKWIVINHLIQMYISKRYTILENYIAQFYR